MFLFEKYRPNSINDIIFNRDIIEQLFHITVYDDIPHIIISGPVGGGKKTIIRLYLEKLYDTSVNILSKKIYPVSGSSSKKDVEIMQSNHHIVIEPTNTNHDKYILQDIIKQYAMYKSFDIFVSKRKFKTIIIYNVDNLSINCQAALRRTMENYARSCRFIMVCNNLSKLFEPLRSRCRIFCAPTPSENDIKEVIMNICLNENIKLNSHELRTIIKNSNGNLKKSIWLLDTKRLKIDSLISLDEIYKKIISIILNSPNDNNILNNIEEVIRTHIYNILITNIKGQDIIINILDLLINNINNEEIIMKIIQHASNAEFNLSHGRRDILSIEYFIVGVVKELIHKGNKVIKKQITLTPTSKKKNSGSKKSSVKK